MPIHVSQNFDVSPGTPVAASATAGSGAQCQVTLPAAAGMTTYIATMLITGDAVASVVSTAVTIDGVIGGPLNYRLVETVSAGSCIAKTFIPALPASAQNQAITVTVASVGGGGTIAVEATGWQLQSQ